MIDISSLGSGLVYPHIFEDPDPGSQIVPGPDPKHWEPEGSEKLKSIKKNISQ